MLHRKSTRIGQTELKPQKSAAHGCSFLFLVIVLVVVLVVLGVVIIVALVFLIAVVVGVATALVGFEACKWTSKVFGDVCIVCFGIVSIFSSSNHESWSLGSL